MRTGQLPTHGRGLKDHEIAQIASALRDELQPLLPRHVPLRSRIATALLIELDRMGLHIDAQPRVATSEHRLAKKKGSPE